MRPSLVLRYRATASKTPGLDKARKARRKAVLPLALKLAKDDTRTGAAATRADIVSPALCDDILSYIGPSLEQYKHCDIIDANPGAALWSSRVHEYLKPRRHILLEPDAFYKPYLQPLLDQPGSKYVHGPACETVLQSLRETLKSDLLPDQHALKHGDPDLNKTNNTLLLLLNLSRIKAATSRTAYFLVRDTVNALTATAWTHTGIHQYGQIRMLVWIGDYFQERLLPKDVNQMDSYGFSFQHRTDTKVIALDSNPKLPREDTTLELSSAVRSVEKMRKLGLELPPNRQTRMHQIALALLATRTADDVQAELKSAIIALKSTNEEVEELQAAFDSGTLKTPGSELWQARLTELLKISQRSRKNRRNEFSSLVPLWSSADELHQLELAIVDESLSAQERLAAKEKFDELASELSKKARKLARNRFQIFYNVLDNRRAFYHDPSYLSWDNRPFEPLHTEPHEFYPQQNLALLDITPKPAPREYSTLDIHYWQRFADKLFERQAAPISKALDSLRIGSAELILPQVGAVNDPRRGGSLNTEEVRVRCLTPEMVDGIVDAWRSWEFRPESLEKILTETRIDWDDVAVGSGVGSGALRLIRR